MQTKTLRKTLGEVSTIIMGASPPGESYNSEGTGLPLLNGPTEFGGSFPTSTLFTTDSKQECEVGDLIFCVRGSTTGRMNWADQKYSLGRGVCSIRGKDVLETKFIKYSLDLNLKELLNLAGGGTFPNLTKDDIHGFQINYPKSRKQFAQVILRLDRLIDINQTRIDKLENKARLLYREWFVEFRFPGYEKHKFVDSELGKIPEGWKFEKIGDRMKVKRGRMITSKTITEGNVPVVAGGLEPAYYHNIPNVTAPVVTISASGANSGYVNLYSMDIWASDCSYISEKQTQFVYYYHLQLKTRQIEVTNLQMGAAQPHVYPKDIMDLETLYPGEDFIKEFESVTGHMFELIDKLTLLNKNIRETRNLLLPKLMSGEIDVSKLDINISEN